VDSPSRAPFDVPSCLIDKQSVSKCTYPRDGDDEYSRSMVSRFEDLIYLKTNDQMCSEDLCNSVVEGLVTFRDQLHFTRTFALSLTPLFAKALDLSA